METFELRIFDLGTAAYLHAVGHKLVGLDYAGRGRYSFRFADDSGQSTKDADAYFAGAMVPARELVEAMKILKQILYREKEKRNGNGNRELQIRENSRNPSRVGGGLLLPEPR